MRSLEEVNSTLARAKLQESDVKSITQSIYYSNENTATYKLLQLDEHLLQSITENATVKIVGHANEKAVICTDSKTYDVMNAETSNSLLLLENFTFSSEMGDSNEKNIQKAIVCGTFHNYLEATPSHLKIKQLRDLLAKSEYSGSENEYKIPSECLYTTDELSNLVQGSRHELAEALQQLITITIDGKARSLEFQYHFRVLSYMLGVVDENSWAADEVQLTETITALNAFVPQPVVLGLWEAYTEESGVVGDDGRPLYRYLPRPVCQFMARVILHSANTFNLRDFLQAWAESVPDGMVIEECWLYGIANIDRSKKPATIALLTEDMLPVDNVKLKLKMLFDAKEKWTVPEITPYIMSDTTEKMDANALLAKFARASNLNGVTHYSSKHGK